MALSKAGLTKALKKYKALQEQGKTIDEITTELQVDENGYEADEVKQILDALGIVDELPSGENKDQKKEDESAEKPNKPELPQSKNAAKENPLAALSSIDYKNLVGDEFKKYVELVGDRSFTVIDDLGRQKPVVGKLKQDQSYDFEQYRVKPVRKERFPGMEGSPVDFIGIEIVRDKPEHTTRIPVSIALEFNAQILNAHSIAGNGRYYLLKKNQ